eukprot:g41227.t1
MSCRGSGVSAGRSNIGGLDVGRNASWRGQGAKGLRPRAVEEPHPQNNRGPCSQSDCEAVYRSIVGPESQGNMWLRELFGGNQLQWVLEWQWCFQSQLNQSAGLSNQPPSTDTLICLNKLILTLNNFSFNSSQILQTKGVAMGTHMGPSYACPFVGYMEQSLFRCYTGTLPHLFLRYIDDCIDAASCSHEEFEQFINFTNTFHPNFKFTWTISDTSCSFLDLFVSIS